MGELYSNEDEKSRDLMNELNELATQNYFARQSRGGFSFHPSYELFSLSIKMSMACTLSYNVNKICLKPLFLMSFTSVLKSHTLTIADRQGKTFFSIILVVMT